MRRSWQLAALAVVSGLGAPKAEDDYEWNADAADLTCFVSGDHASIERDSDGYTVTNATVDSQGRVVINLVLEDQEAQFELPGMLLRVSTAKYVPLDDPFANLEELRQGLWGTVGGNVLGMLFFTFIAVLIIYLEKKFQCVGGEKIHALVEQQGKMQEELSNAVEFLKEFGEDQAVGSASKLGEDLPQSGEDAMVMAGKKAASKAADGAMVSTIGRTKTAAIKKGAEKIAETDEYAEAKEKVAEKVEEKRGGKKGGGKKGGGKKGRGKKKQKKPAEGAWSIANPLMAASADDADD